MALPESLYLKFSMRTVASLTGLCGLKRRCSLSRNIGVEINQAVDIKLDELWVTAFWNQSSVEPFRSGQQRMNATWWVSSGKS